MPKKLLLIIVVGLFLSSGSALGDNNSSGIEHLQLDNSNSAQYNLTDIEFEEIKGSEIEIDFYSSYKVNVPSGKPKSVRISIHLNNSWVDEAETNGSDIFLLNGPYKRYYHLRKKESNVNYSVFTTTTQLVNGSLIVGKTRDIEEEFDIKINGNNCGPYIDPHDNLSKVKDCRYHDGSLSSSIEAFVSNKIELLRQFKEIIIFSFVSIPLYILFRKFETKLIEKKVERTTEKIIQAKESNNNISQSVLEKLEKANEEAYEKNYDKSKKIVDSIVENYSVNNIWRKELLLILGIIITIAFSLRFLSFETRVMWWDELFTWWVTRLRFEDSLTIILDDVNPPLYYFALRIWGIIVGSSEFAFRFLSLIFSILAIVYVYLFGRIINLKTGIFSTILVALSWYHVVYSVEIRFYSLMSLLSIMSIYHLIQFLDSQNNVDKTVYILSTIMLLYTHVYGFFVLTAHTLFLLWKYYSERLNFKVIRPYIAVILGIVPLIIFYIFEKDYLYLILTGKQEFWITNPGIKDLIEAFEIFSGSSEMLILFLFLAVISLHGWINQKDEKIIDTNIMLWISVVSIVIIPWLISYIVFPIFKPRYLISGALIFYVIVGYGLNKLSNFPIQMLVIVIIVLFSSFSVNQQIYQEEPNEPWDEVVEQVESGYNGEGNVIYSGHWARFAFERYGEKEINIQSVPEKHMYDPSDDYKFVSTKRSEITRQDIDKTQSLIEDSPYTWLVLSHEKGLSDELIIRLNKHYEEMRFYDYNGIELYKFYN